MKERLTIDLKLLEYLNSVPKVYTRLHAFADLAMSAVTVPTTVMKRGIRIDLQPGQLEASTVELSNKWKWDRRTVASFLNRLEHDGYIRKVSSNVSTIIEWCFQDGCTAEPVEPSAAESTIAPARVCGTLCMAELPTALPDVLYGDGPMQLPDDVRAACREVYDLFLQTFPLLEHPEEYDDRTEKDIYYVFILGMKGRRELLEQYFSQIASDPFKNGTMAARTGVSAYKSSFRQLFSSVWQQVLGAAVKSND